MEAFWVKGKEILDLGYARHVHAIMEDPERFGLTKELIKQTYKKHKEKLYSEGNAREELIKTVARNGWIRVREYPGYMSIQFDRDRMRKKTIQDFVYWAMITKKIISRTQSLVLIGYDDDYQDNMTASKFLTERKVLLESRKKTDFVVIHLMEPRTK